MTDPTIPDPPRTLPGQVPGAAADAPAGSAGGATAGRGTARFDGPAGREDDAPSVRPPKNFVQQVLGQWPLAIVLLGVAIGLAIVATSHWRLGTTLVGASVTLGGLLRLLLPRQYAGLLAVRNKVLDTVVLLAIGVGIVVLAFLVPPTRV